MKIKDHCLYYDNDMPYPFVASPNVGSKLKAQYLIMHYTATPSASSAINWLTKRGAQASAHVVIGRDGNITQLVRFDRVAWHAGKSRWGDLDGMNNYSIGIELENVGPLDRSAERWISWFGMEYPPEQVIEAVHKYGGSLRGWQLFSPEQLFTALELSSLLVQEYGLKDILGHDDIAPGRKTDPGPAFPMDTFRARVYGRPDIPTEEEAPKQIYQTTTALNIRSGPGSQFDILAGSPLPKGTRMEALMLDGNWRQVYVLDKVNNIMDLEGWVHGRYIEPITSAVPASSSTPTSGESSASASTIGTEEPTSRSIEPPPSPPVSPPVSQPPPKTPEPPKPKAPEPVAAPPKQFYQTTTGLNIRSGPGAYYDLLSASPLPKGTQMEVLASDGDWRQVRVQFTNVEGWVHGRYIEAARSR